MINRSSDAAAARRAGIAVAADDAVLSVQNLTVEFQSRRGAVSAVTGVDLELHRGEVLGLVGESGCGKSVTSLATMGLLPARTARMSGSIRLGDQELVGLSERELRRIRGKRIAMIFQEPMTSLNPAYTVGNQLMEPLRVHLDMPSRQARSRAEELLALVGIPRPVETLRRYPHELSGGMRQRVMIAMAMACEPDVIIADEPTTALDVTIQAQVLQLLTGLTRSTGTAIVLITHDLGVVAETCDSVAVMYAGEIVERTDVHTLFARPGHPYTQGLLDCLPSRNLDRTELSLIPGSVPPPGSKLPGCRFAPRCAYRFDACEAGPIPMLGQAEHRVRCLLEQETR